MDRAQILQGLRTGGPRSASFGNVPMSASPATTRFASNTFQPQLQNQFIDEPTIQLTDRFGNMSINSGIPMSAGGIEMAARLQQQQQQGQQIQQQLMLLQAQLTMLATSGGSGPLVEAQAVQLQMEIVRLQALQQQHNFQTQLLLQSQMAAAQQQAQAQANQVRRLSEMQQLQQQQQVPSTAGPLTSSFAEAANAQTRMAATNQLRARTAGRQASLNATLIEEDPAIVSISTPPMTAAVNGRFANVQQVQQQAQNRAVSSPLNPNAAAFVGRFTPDLSAAIAAASKAPAVAEPGTPSTPSYGSTTVISGGTSLGGSGLATPITPSAATTPSHSYNGLSGYNNSAASPGAPTKSDSALSWRRPSATPNMTATSPPPSGASPRTATSPPRERQRSTSPPTSTANTPSRLSISSSVSSVSSGTASGVVSPLKTRPSPLRFANPAANPDVVARAGSPTASADGHDTTGGSLNGDGGSSKSSPTSSTPPSSAGSAGVVAAKESLREEASRKLYEGLGIGRPAPSPAANQTSFSSSASIELGKLDIPTFVTTAPTPNTPHHPAVPTPVQQQVYVVVQKVEPLRQPIGPPCAVDELGAQNFATRMRKKALGGLGVLMDARERREGSGSYGQMMMGEVAAY